MLRIERTYAKSAKAIWEAVMDPDVWPISTEAFALIEGACFTAGRFPALGSRFTGTLECEVQSVVPHESFSAAICAAARSGAPASWTLAATTEVSQEQSRVVITIDGNNRECTDEQNLVHMLGTAIQWVLDHAGETPRRRQRIRLHRFGR